MAVITEYHVRLSNGWTFRHEALHDTDRVTGTRALNEVRANCARSFGKDIHVVSIKPLGARIV